MLVLSEAFESIDEARARERQIKGWTRAKKEALIVADRARLKALSPSSSAQPLGSAGVRRRSFSGLAGLAEKGRTAFRYQYREVST